MARRAATDFVGLRDRAFKARVLPVLFDIGFVKCPMGRPWWGGEPHGGRRYDLCRLAEPGILELLPVHIIRREAGFKPIYHQVELVPAPGALDDLKAVDDMPFHLPPASATEMRIPPPRWLGAAAWPAPFEVSLWRRATGIGLEAAVEDAAERMERAFHDFDRYRAHWRKTFGRCRFDWDGTLLGD